MPAADWPSTWCPPPVSPPCPPPVSPPCPPPVLQLAFPPGAASRRCASPSCKIGVRRVRLCCPVRYTWVAAQSSEGAGKPTCRLGRLGLNLKPGTVCVFGMKGLRKGTKTTQHPPKSPADTAWTEGLGLGGLTPQCATPPFPPHPVGLTHTPYTIGSGNHHLRQPGVEPRESLFCRGQKATMPVVL